MPGSDLSSVLALLSQSTPAIQTQKALILCNIQQDFFAPDGKLPIHTDDDYFTRINTLVQGFRPYGQVIWVRTEYGTREIENSNASVDDPHPSSRKRKAATIDDNASEPPPEDEWAMPATDEIDEELAISGTIVQDVLIQGTSGAQFADQIQHLIKTDDIQLVKNHYSAFDRTSLLLSLRSRFITELYICGCLTNITVYATAVDAARYGIKVTLVDDCLSYRRRDRHDLALQRLSDHMIAGTMSTTSLLHTLQHPELDDFDVDTTEENELEDERDDITRQKPLTSTSATDQFDLEPDSDEEDDEMPLPAALSLRLSTSTVTQPRCMLRVVEHITDIRQQCDSLITTSMLQQ